MALVLGAGVVFLRSRDRSGGAYVKAVRPQQGPVVNPVGGPGGEPGPMPAPEPSPGDGSATRPGFEARRLLSLLLDRHLKVNGPRHGYNRFGWEREMRFREARLVALCCPDETEEWAAPLAEDAGKPARERAFAIEILGNLMAQGRPGSEAALLRIAWSAGLNEDGTEKDANLALYEIYPRDLSSKHLQLYMDKAALGLNPAFEALARSSDPAAVALCRRFAGMKENEAWQIRGEAKAALEKMDILGSPDWATRLQRMIESPEVIMEGEGMPWAVLAARAKNLAGLDQMLRRRLDWGMWMSREWHEEWRRRTAAKNAFLGRTTPSFEERYVADVNGETIQDPCHDDLLVLYAEMGGQFNDLEKRRLREFGYACDPRERLLELMPELR